MAGNTGQVVYDLFVTFVDKLGPLLKIWGQTDRKTSVLIEQMLLEMLPIFNEEDYVVPITSLQPGLICCAKYKDGIYYRAQIRSLKAIETLPVAIEVRFIDYGNIEFIKQENIRLFRDNTLKAIASQASEFILAGVVNAMNLWDDKSISFVHNEFVYTELKAVLLCNNADYKLVKVMLPNGLDMAAYLTNEGLATSVSPQVQDIILRNMSSGIGGGSPAMAPPSAGIRPSTMRTLSARGANSEVFAYRSQPMPPGTERMVYVSYVEEGPLLFYVQLQSIENDLERIMEQINSASPLQPFTQAPLPGSPCLARFQEDRSVCRAVVLNVTGDSCKVFYVDFGNMDVLPFSDVFQIPCDLLRQPVMSMRFTLAGLEAIPITEEVNCAFKEHVTNRLLVMKVLKTDDSSLMQCCELYDTEGGNVMQVLYEASGEYRFLTMEKGAQQDVIVSYIEGCKRFFVQLKECSVSLSNLMLALESISVTSPALANADVNCACSAFFAADGKWYRGKIVSLQNNAAVVRYVDFGNEEAVELSLLKRLDPKFISILPAQAIECCLLGYQNMSFNTEIEEAFESLTLEREFSMKVMGKQANAAGTLLVDLFDGDGNNVAALLIERLAAQKSQSVGPLPAQQVTSQQPGGGVTTLDRDPPRDRQTQWRKDDTRAWRNSQTATDMDKPNRYCTIYMPCSSKTS